jgi:hypothetical protein
MGGKRSEKMSDVVNAGASAQPQGQVGEGSPVGQQPEGQNPALMGEGGAPQVPGGVIGEAAKEAMRKYRVKVEGQEIEVDEKELLRGYSHQRAAAKALNEGKALRKQAEQVLEMLNSEDHLETLLKKMGKDPRQLAEKILARHLEDELMDPRDRELRDAKLRLKEIEDMDKRQKEALEKHRLEQVKKQYMGDYEKQFVDALEKEQVPRTKKTVAEMAKYIQRSIEISKKTGKPYVISAIEAAKLVKDDIIQAQRSLVAEADGETLLKLFGEDLANKIRKYDTAKVKNPNAFLQTPQQATEHRERGEPKKRMSAREWQLMKRGLK